MKIEIRVVERQAISTRLGIGCLRYGMRGPGVQIPPTRPSGCSSEAERSAGGREGGISEFPTPTNLDGDVQAHDLLKSRGNPRISPI